MFNRYSLAALVCAFFLTTTDASAGIFGRRSQSDHGPSPCPTPCAPAAPAEETAQTAPDPFAVLSVEEKDWLQKMMESGYYTDQIDALAFTVLTVEQRKAKIVEFLEASKVKPMTQEDLVLVGEMLKAGPDNGGLSGAGLTEYEQSATYVRKAMYKNYTQFIKSVTAEELTQFAEMVKAGRAKGGYDIEQLSTYRAMSPQHRKAVYDAFKKGN